MIKYYKKVWNDQSISFSSQRIARKGTAFFLTLLSYRKEDLKHRALF
jgi:hypothetical protein